MEEKIEPAKSPSSDWIQHEKATGERTAAQHESSIESAAEEEERDGANGTVEDGSNNYLTGWRLSVTTIGHGNSSPSLFC